MEKNVVKINENTLKQIVTESVKKVLKEYGYDVSGSGYESYQRFGKSAAYWVMNELKKDKLIDVKEIDSQAISTIINNFGITLKTLADIGDIDNGVRGFGIKQFQNRNINEK